MFGTGGEVTLGLAPGPIAVREIVEVCKDGLV